MRYSSDSPLTAEEVVNRYQPKDLERIFREYGEEKFARRIASNIIRNRRVEPIRTTTQLAEIVRKSLPVFGKKANETVRRVFQSLRIEVNSELQNLKIALPKALEVLKSGGRLVVISFHSLEDRIVKEFFNQQAKDCVCPPEFPTCICGKASTLRILTRKPIIAQESEILNNPRSKPAKLRAAEKI
jgi:16S rRNA (cytosine1402-N4)-methyltransferase